MLQLPDSLLSQTAKTITFLRSEFPEKSFFVASDKLILVNQAVEILVALISSLQNT
jgi:hypothetical protein